MHSFHQTAAILKLTDKHKGPSGSLCRVRTEIPVLRHFEQYHNLLTMENSDSQSKLRGTKKKSLSKQIDFFLLFKQYQKSESEDPLAFPKS